MTNAEYYREYIKAQKQLRQLIISGREEINEIYLEASALLDDVVRNAEKLGFDDLTIASWKAIQEKLDTGSIIIYDNVDELINRDIIQIGKNGTTVDKTYLTEAFEDAKIPVAKIENLYLRVDDRLIASLYSRIWQDGYSYSDRLWRAATHYQTEMKKIIQLGLSQGRDMIDIARDIEIYVLDGKQALLNRIGDLVRGTSDFARRIGKNVDYNAVRILRSELFASLQDVSKISGQLNPGCTGWYEWVRTFAEDFNCECPDYEKSSPYKLDDIPSYPHPNCSCLIRPVLRNRQEFVNDLTAWSNGDDIDYLDEWNLNYFTFAA